jgi:hypothetical protein
MGASPGLSTLIQRKLGRCLNCLRLALTGAIVIGAAAGGVSTVSSLGGWVLAAIALAFASVAVAHMVVMAARVGVKATLLALLAVYRRLGCGCNDIPVGHGLRRWYATKEECEEDIPDTYDDAADQASALRTTTSASIRTVRGCTGSTRPPPTTASASRQTTAAGRRSATSFTRHSAAALPSCD